MVAFIEHRPTARVIAILEILANNKGGVSLTEISQKLGFPKGTISPIMQTLVKRKFIFLNKDTKRYSIGLGLYCAGASYANNMTALQFINREMQYIVKKTGEICQMGVLDRGDVLFVAKVDSEEPIRVVSHVGAKLPAYCTALGKALLSQKDIDEIRCLYPHGLKSVTLRTITKFEILEQELEETRSTKIAVEHGESNEQASCIAVPLSKNDGQIIAAISISIPFFRETCEKVNMVKKLLLESKNTIEIYFREHDIDADNLTLRN